MIYQEISRREAETLRPSDKDGLIRVSSNPKYNPPAVQAAVDAGEIDVGDVLRRRFVVLSDVVEAGTHDGIRDGASNRVVYRFEFSVE